MGVGGAGGLLQLRLCGVGVAESEILGHRAVEEVGILGHHGDMLAQFFQRDVPHIAPAQPNDALLGVEEPQH